jgi:hypothetical protein
VDHEIGEAESAEVPAVEVLEEGVEEAGLVTACCRGGVNSART